MKTTMKGIKIHEDNGLIIESSRPLYVFANRGDMIFKNTLKIDNHYPNDTKLEKFIVERNGITVISSVEYLRSRYFTNITILLDTELDDLNLIYIFKTAIETISATSWKMNAINNDKLDNDLGNFYNMIFVACRGKSEKKLIFDISLFYEVKEIVDEAVKESLKVLQ